MVFRGGYLVTCLKTPRCLETRFLKPRSCLSLVTSKSRLGLGPLCLKSKSRHCSNVGKGVASMS